MQMCASCGCGHIEKACPICTTISQAEPMLPPPCPTPADLKRDKKIDLGQMFGITDLGNNHNLANGG